MRVREHITQTTWLQIFSALGLGILGASGLVWLYPAEEFSFENRAHTTIDIVLFGSFAVLLSIALRFDLCSLDFATLRFLYSVPAVSLLLYRVVLYFHQDYVLFLLDLCPIAQCLLLWTLWFAYTDGYLEWQQAVFMVMNGPVAGSTFLLGTKIEVQHP